MTTNREPPSHFLPILPRGQHATLSPLLSDRLSECIASLRTLMLPSIVGIDGSVIEQSELPQTSKQSTDNRERGYEADFEDDEGNEVIMDEFERQWAENWLNQVIRRGETWIAEVEEMGSDEHGEVDNQGHSVLAEAKIAPDVAADVDSSHALTRRDSISPNQPDGQEGSASPQPALLRSHSSESMKQTEVGVNDSSTRSEFAKRHDVIQSAASLLSLLSGCSASGAITRSLTFPLSPLLLSRSLIEGSLTRHIAQTASSGQGTGPKAFDLVIQINDAPLADHLSVGVQTWGSSVLLGREMAADPEKFGLGVGKRGDRAVGRVDGGICGEAKYGQDDGMADSVIAGPRILELGAGTGVLSIICRALLDIASEADDIQEVPTYRAGIVVATDYHPLVLSNLQACVDLNFPPQRAQSGIKGKHELERPAQLPAIHVMPLDWSTFPAEAERVLGDPDERELVDKLDLIGRIKEVGARKGLWSLPVTPSPTASPASLSNESSGAQERDAPPAIRNSALPPPLDKPFDMILACDCVYDLTHATLLRETASWLLQLPDPDVQGDRGGVLHLLSPVRRTYSEETTSIVEAFPWVEMVPARRAFVRTGKGSKGNSRSQTPSNRSGIFTPGSEISTAHSASAVDLVALRSGLSTPLELTEAAREVFSQGMGLGKKGGWRLCTVERKELERLSGHGRSDELTYMWWTIMWC